VKRREFIALLGGAAVARPLAARGQQPGKLAKIGYLGSSTALAQSQWTAAFVHRLRELGWIEARNVMIEYRWAEGRNELFGEIAAEFVRLKVDVIVAAGTAPVLATKRATSVIPIVFPLAGDPVGNGLVASLARRGGNITGLSLQTTDIGAKRLELLREVVAPLGRLAIMANVGNASAALEMDEVLQTARGLGLDVTGRRGLLFGGAPLTCHYPRRRYASTVGPNPTPTQP
jgi:putative ABC transport system substrate-binding protein